jgi:hypothetical protein
LLWQRYRTWANTAAHFRRQHALWNRNVLILTIVGTGLATLGPHAGAHLSRALPVAGAVALALATYFGKELLDAKHQESWTRSRAAAEALKSEACKYLTQVPPFDGPDRTTRLRLRLDEVATATKDQTPLDISEDQARKGVPTQAWTIKDYITNRLDDQVAWYKGKARDASASMTRGRAISLSLGCVSVLLGVVTGATTDGATVAAAILGLVTTAGGSIGAYFQAGHYDGIALKYRETASALETLRAEFNSGTGQQDPAALVLSAETIIQAENAAWLTGLTAKT